MTERGLSEPLTDADMERIENSGVLILRDDVLRLVAEVRRLREEVDRLEYALEKADAAIRNTSDYR